MVPAILKRCLWLVSFSLFYSIVWGSGIYNPGSSSGGTPAGSSGQLQYNNSSSFGGAAGFTYQSGASPNVKIQSQNSTYTPLILKGASSQSADYFTVQDSNASPLFEMTKDGYLGVGTSSVNGGSGKTVQIGDQLILQSVVGVQGFFGNNAYYSGSAWKNIATGTSQFFRFTNDFDTNGQFTIMLEPSNTAGTTLTHVDDTDVKLLLTQAGNLAISTSSMVVPGSSNRMIELGNNVNLENVLALQLALNNNAYFSSTDFKWRTISPGPAQFFRFTQDFDPEGVFTVMLASTNVGNGILSNVDTTDVKLILTQHGQLGISTNAITTGNMFQLGGGSMAVTSVGHWESKQSTVPVVSSCGTGATMFSLSTDVNGIIATGTGVFTSCTVTFLNVWSHAPACIIDDQSSVLASPPKVATSATAMTISGVTITAGDSIGYICIGNQ